jgi:hypothetical protein
MLKYVIVGIATLLINSSIVNKKSKKYTPILLEKYENTTHKSVNRTTKDHLLEAMIQVESRGNETCIGDKHLGRPSIGVLQIRPIMVREVNRILKKHKIKKKYSLDDRYNREYSIEMFYIWRFYHHPNDSDEIIARCWNGGPKGWKRKSTKHYWNKVKKEIEISKDGEKRSNKTS